MPFPKKDRAGTSYVRPQIWSIGMLIGFGQNAVKIWIKSRCNGMHPRFAIKTKKQIPVLSPLMSQQVVPHIALFLPNLKSLILLVTALLCYRKLFERFCWSKRLFSVWIKAMSLFCTAMALIAFKTTTLGRSFNFFRSLPLITMINLMFLRHGHRLEMSR